MPPPPLPSSVSSASSRAVVTFCKARAALEERENETRRSRQENLEAKKALLTLVGESMAKAGVSDVCVSGRGGTVYVRRVPTYSRPKPLTSEEDLATVVGGAGEIARSVPRPDLPEAVVRMVRERMRLRGEEGEKKKRKKEEEEEEEGTSAPPPPSERITVSSRPPPSARGEGGSSLSSPAPLLVPDEVTRLASQLVEVNATSRAENGALLPARKAVKEAEKELLQALEEPVSVLATRNGEARKLRIAKRKGPERCSKPVGTRILCDMCRQAARSALEFDLSEFETRFERGVAEAFRAHLQTHSACKERIQTLRLPRVVRSIEE